MAAGEFSDSVQNFQELTQGSTSPWQAAATVLTALIVTAVPVVGSVYMAKVKRSADQDKTDAKPVIDRAQDALDLEPAVLSLTRQLAALEASVEPIVKYRYPRAVEYIALLHERDEKLAERSPVPVVLREDVARALSGE